MLATEHVHYMRKFNAVITEDSPRKLNSLATSRLEEQDNVHRNLQKLPGEVQIQV